MTAATPYGMDEPRLDMRGLAAAFAAVLIGQAANDEGAVDAALAEADELIASARRAVEVPIPSLEGWPRAALMEARAGVCGYIAAARPFAGYFAALAASTPESERIGRFFASMRDAVASSIAQGEARREAFEHEIDSLDAAEALQAPSHAVPWDESAKTLDLA